MGLDTPMGVLISLLFLLPGALGAGLSRMIHQLAEPANDFRRVLEAVSWSVAALGTVETVNALATKAHFGDFVLLPLTSLSSASPEIADLTGRWLVLVGAALLLPPISRALAGAMTSKYSRRTLERPSIDMISKYAPLLDNQFMFLEATLKDDESVCGWLRWRTVGNDDKAAIILKHKDSQSVTWIPVSSIVALTAVDPTTIEMRSGHTGDNRGDENEVR